MTLPPPRDAHDEACIDRRSLMRLGLGGLAGSAAVAGLSSASHAAPIAAPHPLSSPAPSPACGPARSLRFAHLTDIHLFDERNAPAGFAAALRHVQESPQSAELVITGGDLIFDSFETGLGVARDRWDLFTRMLREHLRVPVEHCLGNHDLWGWCAAKCGSHGDEREYGSGLARQALGISADYRSFDRGGWHVVLLQSVAKDPADDCGYLALLGEEQTAWLEADLAATTLPTVVVSHIPIVSVTPFVRGSGYRGANNRGTISGGLLHLDAQPIHAILRRTGCVKLVLSGHMHLIDRCEADGITYCCDGAVSGGWWKANANHCPPSYALIDLFDDGTFNHRMVEFGWTNA
jgi:3',5'-cyclic AMP phosphodiesterase CpdA